MFRRLASVLQEPQERQGQGQGQGQGYRKQQDGFQGGAHLDYIQEQDKYFKTLPHLIPAATSGLDQFDRAIQTADMTGAPTYQDPAIAYPNDIFRAVPSPGLTEMAAYCSASGLDALLAAKSPTENVGCGWLYTPPAANSPYPKVSKGFLGKRDGPIKAFDPPPYQQWFFDLEAAKRQVLLDKCKALKSCAEVDNEIYQGDCGYCTHTNQGVPIDKAGQPLYPSDPRGGCDSDAIVRSAAQCPPPPPPAAGPAPMVDRTCEPLGGRLGAECLRRQVLAAGCNERGSLALALSGSPSPTDYISGLRDSDAVKLYQRMAQPPLNLEVFSQGRATTQQVLQEARQLVAQTAKPESTGLGLAARDLCLRRGAFEAYDICSEVSDSQPPPYNLSCLQRLFLQMGGTASGKMYPSEKTMSTYNSFGSWGAVKQYLQTMYRAMYANTAGGPPRGLKEGFSSPQGQGGGDQGSYQTQRQAMVDFLGIVPEKAIQRVPYRQGVEVFWFVPGDARMGQGKPPKLQGFLRRTVERDIVQLQPGPSRVAQIGGGPCAAMIQLTDIRAQEAASVKFQVNIDDGFWLTVNQPHSVDRKAMEQVNADEPGFFENNWYQGPTWYSSKSCTPFSPSTPNITKMFYQDSGCGWNAFLVNPIPCSGANPFQKALYSMTLENRAPFLAFEVGKETGRLEEVRLPAAFEQWLDGGHFLGHTVMNRTDDRQTVPGKKGFVRMNNMRSLIDMHSIAFQSWKTMTFAVRFQSMPVKETLVKVAPGRGYVSLVLTPSGGGVAVALEHNLGGGGVKTVPFRSGLQVGKWYLFAVLNRGTGFDLQCYAVEESVASKGKSGGIGTAAVNHTGPLFLANETLYPKSGSGQPAGQCRLMWGAQRDRGMEGVYGTGAFEYDLAWIHFFDQFVSSEDIYRDCMGDWQYTQFPVAYQTFQTLED
jgi:hypothetical protein